MTREELEAAKAAALAEVAAEYDAKIAALDEPDWGAAVERFADAAGFVCGNLPEVLESIRAGLIVAAPLMPTAAMTDAEIEELADKAALKAWPASYDWSERDSFRDGYRSAIRATIARLGHGRKAGDGA